MRDTMLRGRSQVIWRYMPGSTFRYNESGGWCEVTAVTIRNPAPLSSALAGALAHELRRWDAVSPSGYPDPIAQPGKYEVGEPYDVRYNVWPTVFTCRSCGRVHWYRDVDALRGVNDRMGCRTCRGQNMLRQVPYAYVCECGRKDSSYIPKHPQDHTISLVDKGSFQESYWFCKVCHQPLHRNAREGMGYRSCECAPRKAKRGVILQDSRVYYSQTVELVEVEPGALERWRENPRFGDLLLAASIGTDVYVPRHILDLASQATGDGQVLGMISPELQAVREILLREGKPEKVVEQIIRESMAVASTDPWAQYDEQLAPHRVAVANVTLSESRQTVEYVFVRDEPSMATIMVRDIVTEATLAGDHESSHRLADEVGLASSLGLVDLAVVEALPVLLAGYGYTRYFASPQTADDSGEEGGTQSSLALRPFPEHANRIPIYAARNTTEAFAYRLDPWRLAAFLELNQVVEAPAEALKSEVSVRAWLLGLARPMLENGESHLSLTSFERAAGTTVDQPSALLFGVIHSVSHVLKGTAHRYVGVDADSLAEYLFPAHGAGLLYVSSHVDFTLGGIDSVVRSNLTQWLGSARDYAGRCSFDPVCAHAGGACLACIYPKFGCAYFNRTVSRSFLFGGRVLGRAESVVGFWEPTAAERAAEWKKSSDSTVE